MNAGFKRAVSSSPDAYAAFFYEKLRETLLGVSLAHLYLETQFREIKYHVRFRIFQRPVKLAEGCSPMRQNAIWVHHVQIFLGVAVDMDAV